MKCLRIVKRIRNRIRATIILGIGKGMIILGLVLGRMVVLLNTLLVKNYGQFGYGNLNDGCMHVKQKKTGIKTFNSFIEKNC